MSQSTTDHVSYQASAPPPHLISLVLSWFTLALAIMALCFLAWYIPPDRVTLSGILKDFGTEPPIATQIVLSIPDFALRGTPLLLVMVLIALQLLVRSKREVTLFHLAVLVLACVTFIAYRESMFQPIKALMRAVAVRK